ncbi:FAD-binding oxidoreductase [Salinicola rhizosphaerae]|uniref:Oxidoreductase n=1 Tax=Salinicola rhizosphaerae TaxID=1443141 RepID=A0ABQ3E795_9GAMM|nr:FAD-binding oxidoreductase [Salinicola rhizosphaerae]GHB28343.1 oxidoreductase [Salinicola rhizosphaerae]
MTSNDALLDTRLEDLAGLLGKGGLLTAAEDMERYRVDWPGYRGALPLAVARPATTQQVADVVGYCHRHDIPLVPQGGHSGLVGGALPDAETPELVLSLERLATIRDVDPINFTMSVDAGCVLQSIKDAAAEADCDFPLSLGAQGSCQIGGNISTNAGGLNVLRYGMMRQLVLGLEVVLPDGRIYNGMKALHKNNTGYDLKQLFIGAEGTLGVVTGAVLKLSPRAQTTRSALLACPDVDAVLGLYALARRRCCDLLTAFELVPRTCLELALEAAPDLRDPLETPSPVYVLMEVAASGPIDLDTMIEGLFEQGLEAGLLSDGVLAGSDAQAESLWRIREAMLEGQRNRGEHLRTDVALPISSLGEFHARASQEILALSPEATIIAYGHIGDGNLHFNILPPPGLETEARTTLLHELEERLFEIVTEFDGSISAEHGIGRFKQAAFLERLSEPEFDLMRGLKYLLDPRSLLSPGRILPRPGD